MNLQHRKTGRNTPRHTPSAFEALESRTLMAAGITVAPPLQVTVATVSETRLEVAWVDNSTNETSFVLERSIGKSRYQPLATLPAATTGYADAGLLPGTKYRYRVRAAADAAVSKGAVGAGTTAAWSISTAASPDQVDLNWGDYWTGETGYVVTRATGKGKARKIATLPADTTTYSDTTVLRETSYTYTVTAVSGGRKSKPGRGKATTPSEPVPTRPAAPSNLAAAPVTWSSGILTWQDNGVDESGFRVERSRDGQSWIQTAVVGAGVTSHTAESLEASDTYLFRVCAYNAAGDSDFSNSAAVTTPAAPAAPAAPSGLTAVAASTSQINLTWQDNSADEDGFRIERSADGVSFAQIAAVAEGATAYPVTGLNASTTYRFRVVAYNAVGDSIYSNTVTATTAAAAVAPAAPSALTAAAASTSRINLSWSDNSANEDGFNVERSTDGVHFTQVGTVGAGVTTYGATGLGAGARYFFRVRAYNPVGNSAYSNSASATTQAQPTPPASPSSLAAAAVSPSQINLTWQDNSTDEAGFKVERSTDGVNFTQVAAVAAGVTSYAATGLGASTTYHFRVRAYNAAGDSAYGNAATAGTPAALITESFAAGAPGFTTVDGTWGASSGMYAITADNAASTTHLNSRSVHGTALAGDFVFEVDARAEAASAPWANFAVVFGYQDAANYYFFSSNQGNDAQTNGIFRVLNGVSTELADAPDTISPNVTYRVRVERSGGQIRAYRDGVLVASATDSTFFSGQVGLGARQFRAAFDNLVVTGTALPGPTSPPAVPSALAATPASTSRVDLTWSDNSDNESGFRIERSSNGGSTWTQLGTVGANVNTYSATGLSPSTAYSFRVRAFNAVGDSPYSNAASATTPAAPQPPPGGVIAGGWQLVAPNDPARNAANYTGPSNPAALVGLRRTSGTWDINAPGTYGNVDHDGPININVDGVVLENFILRGWHDVSAVGRSNVTIRNFETYGQKSFNTVGADNRTVVIESGALYQPSDGVMWGNYTARRLYFLEVAGDCFKAHGSGNTIEYCYINKVGWPPSSEAHADGLQMFGITNMTFRYNRFDAGEHTGVNSACNWSVSNANHVIEYNYFSGGVYQVYLIPAAGDTSIVRHNRWGRTGSAVYSVGGDFSHIVWEDNAYLDNGELIGRP